MFQKLINNCNQLLILLIDGNAGRPEATITSERLIQFGFDEFCVCDLFANELSDSVASLHLKGDVIEVK